MRCESFLEIAVGGAFDHLGEGGFDLHLGAVEILKFVNIEFE
jgi:hypothetical protein